MGLMTDSDDKLTFREWAIKKSLTDVKIKSTLVWVYRWYTAMTIKKLMLTRNWEETKDAIDDWRAMNKDLGEAVVWSSMSDTETKNNVDFIHTVNQMYNDKKEAREVA